MKGITLEVLKGKYESTNGGLSSKVTEITLVGIGRDSEVFEATDKAPAFMLEMHVRGCLRLVPVGDPRTSTHIGPMFGGNYAAASDSRFRQACEKLLGTPFYGAVAIHDRFETPQQYRDLSI